MVSILKMYIKILKGDVFRLLHALCPQNLATPSLLPCLK